MTEGLDGLLLSANGLSFTASTAGHGDDVVVCLHGFPDTPLTFRHQLPALASAGYRAIAPTMRGYEPSSQPADGDYGLTSLASDVVGWLDHLGVERAHLIGHDWGAAVAYVAGAHHPDRFRSVTALAIPPLTRIPAAVRRVPRQLLRSWYMTWFQLRGLAERSLAAHDWRLVKRLWRGWSPGYEMTATDWEHLRAALEKPGVAAAALQYYRQNATPPILLGARRTDAMRLSLVPAPTLIVNGADDGCMDRRLFRHTIDPDDYPGGVHHVELPGTGHFLHLEQPDEVNALLIDHLGAA